MQANEGVVTPATEGAAPIVAGPFGIPIPSMDGTADGTGGVAYGAQLTFAQRFPTVRCVVSLSLALSPLTDAGYSDCWMRIGRY